MSLAAYNAYANDATVWKNTENLTKIQNLKMYQEHSTPDIYFLYNPNGL